MTEHEGLSHAVIAGVVCALVGFTSSFSVVLAGLRAVGASPGQAASGLTIVSLTMGAGCILFSLRYRMPITMAWSTPGAALLASASRPHGGFRDAVGAFIVCGVLLALTGLVKPLGAAVRKVPTPLAGAMLAGVLVHLCVAPFTALAHSPLQVAPVLLTWLVLLRIARRWAVIGALGACVIVMVATGTFGHLGHVPVLPQLAWVTPGWNASAALALGVPLYIVTMTSQNLPGVAVLGAYDYEAPLGTALIYTGGASAAGALFGGHAINLAAISAALAAAPSAHPDKNKRWVASTACGVTYILFGLLAGAFTAIANAAPDGLFAALAGVALIGTFASTASSALADEKLRESAAITFLVAASGMTIAGIGSAFWALLAGVMALVVVQYKTA